MHPHQIVIDHAVSTAKVAAGGLGVWATTYGFISSLTIEQATAIASLTAAVATTIYFIVSTAIAVLKWRKEKNGP